jgi:hypothetical protein
MVEKGKNHLPHHTLKLKKRGFTKKRKGGLK